MNGNEKAIGMSAFERAVREWLKQADDLDAPDDANSYTPIGVLRGLIRDIEMWREMAKDFSRDITDEQSREAQKRDQ